MNANKAGPPPHSTQTDNDLCSNSTPTSAPNAVSSLSGAAPNFTPTQPTEPPVAVARNDSHVEETHDYATPYKIVGISDDQAGEDQTERYNSEFNLFYDDFTPIDHSVIVEDRRSSLSRNDLDPLDKNGHQRTYGFKKPKLTEEELALKMAQIQIKNAKLSAAHARAEADVSSFVQREALTTELSGQSEIAERQNRQWLMGERERNRIRKLKATESREWDANKSEEDTDKDGRPHQKFQPSSCMWEQRSHRFLDSKTSRPKIEGLSSNSERISSWASQVEAAECNKRIG
ncbi:hypothetical protein K470DRAFT_270962 [Piedraia hortae CBS 480.64]|uniref:Uncharacterized protein n=1 Tax=Piedraia hortae CBS 480.64 TaxID=1314780 RepID=A0A6A7BYF6_9PEZI|nr:hypothetical protein K470DRAFT_270962 [Piedraia hortae CBS 480.64]